MKPSFFKRLFVALILGGIAAMICVYHLSFQVMPEVWGSDLMWVIIANRITIAFVVAIAGVYLSCPISGIRTPSYLRGAILGVLISLELAIGVFIDPMEGLELAVVDLNEASEMMLFIETLLLGGLYGSIIDIFATKIGGEGKELLGEA